MKATISQARHENARNMDGDRERVSTLTLVGIRGGKPVELAQARCWMSRASSASVVYCSVWIYTRAGNSGRGMAKGYGYHKQSAALGAALESAGVTLDADIDGRGDGAMREAMLAVGVAMGHDAGSLAVLS